jgi:SAM-dependent methyltransferase
MSDPIPSALQALLQCPSCGGSLTRHDWGRECDRCGAKFADAEGGRPDFRLRAPKTVRVDYTIGEPLPSTDGVDWKPLRRRPSCEVDFGDLSVPNHLSRALMDCFPKAKESGRWMLDLGCGTALHQPVCERTGYSYAGLDYSNAKAPILGDAHALPFRDGAFDFVLSVAVLEHVQHPAVVLGEVFRVLRPGGRLIGTVSFLEPFHEVSFQHHSHMGVLSALRRAGFDANHIAPGWDGVTAVTHMALLAGAPGWAIRAAVAPLLTLHRAWWLLLGSLRPGWDETTRRLKSAGAFAFVAGKPE